MSNLSTNNMKDRYELGESALLDTRQVNRRERRMLGGPWRHWRTAIRTIFSKSSVGVVVREAGILEDRYQGNRGMAFAFHVKRRLSRKGIDCTGFSRTHVGKCDEEAMIIFARLARR